MTKHRRTPVLRAAGVAVVLGVMLAATGIADASDTGTAGRNTPPAGLAQALSAVVSAGYPGVVAYARQDNRHWQLAAGVADRVTGRPARPGDRWRIFSSTMAFVSVVVLQLAGESRLRLDDTVQQWLPGVVRGNGNDGAAMAVRQLLNNTTGIYDPGNDPAFATDRGGHTPQEVVAAAMAHPPAFPPGTAYGYSNTNAILAGIIIQAVTGHDPATEINHRIIGPLGLASTSFPTSDPTIHGSHLRGYDLDYRDVTRFDPSGEWTAGAMISTAEDLARFHQALFTGHLLRPAQQRGLETTVPTDAPSTGYGLGVQRMTVPCDNGPTTVWETDGGGPGHTSLAMTTEDGTRQLVLAANVFDLRRDQAGQPPVPDARTALTQATTSALCLR